MIDTIACQQRERPPLTDPVGGVQAARTRRRRSRGQSMVEFALLLPVLIMIFAAAADFGRAFTAYITISSAAREGAAYGMQSQADAEDVAGIQAAALADAPEIWGIAPEVFPSTGVEPETSGGYTYVEVRVEYTFEPILTIFPIPATVPMDRTVRMRVIN